MSESTVTLADLATEIRSKNAGPFWVTIEAFMNNQHGYAIADQIITPDLIAMLYAVPTDDILIFRIPDLHVVKVSFPRRVGQASLHDRDLHAGQHHVILGRTPLGSAPVAAAHAAPPGPQFRP